MLQHENLWRFLFILSPRVEGVGMKADAKLGAELTSQPYSV